MWLDYLVDCMIKGKYKYIKEIMNSLVRKGLLGGLHLFCPSTTKEKYIFWKNWTMFVCYYCIAISTAIFNGMLFYVMDS